MSTIEPRRSCPRTGRSRAEALDPRAMRPSDSLTAFLAVGVAWLIAGALCEVAFGAGGPYELRWLGFHFAFVGGISQMVVGAGQFFACAFLATEPPERRTIHIELAVWNAAVACIAVGVPTGTVALTGIGGTFVLAGLWLFDHELRTMRKRSLQTRPWATRWYRTAALFLTIGAALGPAMANATAWPHGSLLGSHLALNLGGWFGTAIVGTLHTLYPSLTGTRLRFERLQPPTWLAWTAGIAAIAVGSAFSLDESAVIGWILLAVAAVLLITNLAASTLSGTQSTTAGTIVGIGQVLLVAAIAEGLVLTLQDGPLAALTGDVRDRIVLPLVAGWIGLTVTGSLVHLLSLMARVRGIPDPSRSHTRDPLAMTGGLTVLSGFILTAIAPVGELTAILFVGGYGLLLGRIGTLAVKAVRAAPLKLRTAA